MNSANIEIQYVRFYFIWTMVMALFGTVLLLSASSTYSFSISQNISFLFTKHIGKIIIGVVMLYSVPMINYKYLSKIDKHLLVCSWVIMVLGYYFSEPGETARWLKIGSVKFQTSDIAKLSLILFTANFIQTYHNKINDYKLLLTKFVPYFIITILLIYFQPDLSSSLVITAIILIMMVVSGLDKKIIFSIGAISALLILLTTHEYQRSRFENWPHRIMFPLNDAKEIFDDQQIKYSIFGLANGGLFGRGLGNSFVKNNFLSEGHTDFIFPIISEELGFIGCTCLLFFSFGLLFHKTLLILQYIRDRFGFFLVIGFISMYLIYFLTHIGYCIGLLPTTGLPLPFLSYGGTNTIINLLSMGIIISVIRFNRVALKL